MTPAPDTPPDPAAGGDVPLDLPPQDARTWAMVAHLSALSGFVVPFGSVLGPLVVWLVKKDEMPYVDKEGKEALNFQITMAIAFIVLGVLSIIPPVFCVTIPLLGVLAIVELVLVIVAGIQASTGSGYVYPFSFKLVT
jgi:uncharacterized Tic20 family protein